MDRDYLERIIKECNIFDKNDIQSAVEKIQSLDERFEKDNLVEIYNYILSVAQNPEILMNTIQCSDRFRDKSSLNPLLDLLLMKNISKECFLNYHIII